MFGMHLLASNIINLSFRQWDQEPKSNNKLFIELKKIKCTIKLSNKMENKRTIEKIQETLINNTINKALFIFIKHCL